MIETYFGFTHTPFTQDIPVTGLFLSESHKELVGRLSPTVRKGAIACITGDIGAGKSTAVRATMAGLHTGTYRVTYLAHPTRTGKDLFRSLLREMGIAPPWNASDARDKLREVMQAQKQEQGRLSVLILDEAQLMPSVLLDELRTLWNFQMDTAPAFSLVLIGQPEFARMLSSVAHESFAQRISLRYHLTGMNRKETDDYVTHHLELAGIHHPLFSQGALTHVFDHSRGLPRKVNILCLRALELAALQGKRLVENEDVELVLHEMGV